MNPELQRNLWLEFSLHRMLAAPVLIALILGLLLAVDTADHAAAIATFGATGFGAVVLAWGTQRSSMSVLEEAQERTWDAQRMSAISPWTMSWGKLLGAPSFTWYVGAMLLPLFVAGLWSKPGVPVLAFALSMLAGALLLHGLALIASLSAARRGVARRGSGFALMMLLLFLFAMPMIGLAREFSDRVQWWHTSFPSPWFLLASLLAYALWALLGAYRGMCAELGRRTLPWTLPVFILFSAIYLAGFGTESRHVGGPTLVLFFGSMLSLALTYLLLAAEISGAASSWQRLLAQARAGHWRRLLQELPLWLVALACAMAFALAALLAPRASDKAVEIFRSGLFPLCWALFALRDAAIAMFFAFARNPRRAEAATLFYLLLLYLLLPGLLAMAGLDGLREYLLAPVIDDPVFACVVMALQAALALTLAVWRWRRVHGPLALGAAAPNAS